MCVGFGGVGGGGGGGWGCLKVVRLSCEQTAPQPERGDMCNLILPFINKKRSYYVDWVSSGEHELGRCNLATKNKKNKKKKTTNQKQNPHRLFDCRRSLRAMWLLISVFHK